ncbi:MAG: DNA-3-methyladenine glycosylase I [Sandaracinaceae bacterium]|nr:MAG: DNA-3-methyladenine glycosylase I [Sandaracinaceae bacterium]
MGEPVSEAAPCRWAGDDPQYRAYHDDEWGRPVGEDRRLYEKLCLEGFQSGLSWLTILRKREAFRRAFAHFDPEAVSRFGEADVARLLQDASIVRHRGKIEAAIHNAARVREVQAELGSFAALIWQFEPDPTERPDELTWEVLKTISTTPASTRLAKALKARGFRFVGPTTAYAFMQSMGLVNDHVEGCPQRAVVERERAAFTRPSEGFARA